PSDAAQRPAHRARAPGPRARPRRIAGVRARTIQNQGKPGMSKSDVLKLIQEEENAYVDIRFTDPRGKLQHVTVVADLVDEDFLDEGFMFDGSSIAGWKSIDQSDMKLMPDPDSAYVDPFYAEKTLCIHCTVHEPDTGESYSRDP